MSVHLKAMGSGNPAEKALTTTRRFFCGGAFFALASAAAAIASKHSRMMERMSNVC